LNIEFGNEVESGDGNESFLRKNRKAVLFGEKFLPCKIISIMPKYSCVKGILEVRMKKS